jgi:hypothetical protein
VIVVGGSRRDGGNQEIEVGVQNAACDAEDGRRASEAGGEAILGVDGGNERTKGDQVGNERKQYRLEGVSNFND